MRKAIFAILLFTASTAYAQFSGGGCSSGGLVDRFSDQSISGAKNFCSTATFNTGLILGLDQKNIIGLTAAALPPTGGLYWGDRQVCDTSGNCSFGAGGFWAFRPVTYSSTLGSAPGFIQVADSTFSVVNSIIEQNNTLEQVILNNYYSLVMISTNNLYTEYKSTGVSSSEGFTVEALQNVLVQSAQKVTVQGQTETLITGGGPVNITTAGQIDISGNTGIELATGGDITLSPTGSLKIGLQTGASGTLTGSQGSCSVGQLQSATFQDGIMVSLACN